MKLPLALLLVAAAACVRPDPAPRFTPAWEPFDPTSEGWLSTRPALIVSDCQIHNLLSRAVPDRNLSIEALAGTAIRPPQLDLFAPDVLAWILANGGPDAEVVLHLGDGLDLACEGELSTFLEVMDGGGRPWFMAPGNHDFYYFGSYDPEDLELWDRACYRSGGRLHKDRFIRLYVASLLAREEPRMKALAEALPGELPLDFEWRAPAGMPGFLDRIAWHIDVQEPWRSFLLQSVDLTRPGKEPWPIHAIMMDSCQYSRRPGLIPNAWKTWPLSLNCGFTGEMLPDQMRTLRAWLEDAGPSERFVLNCHHPFESFAPRTRSSLGWLWRERQIGMLLSGHTHQGFFAHHDLGGDLDQLELNIGSTTDWPMEWRVLTGFMNPEREQSYIRAERFTLVDVLENRQGFFELDWEVPMGAPDDYRGYKQGQAASGLLIDFYLAHHLTPYWLPQPHIRPNRAARDTEEQVKNTLLWTYWRLIKDFPTDAEARPPAWPQGCRSDTDVVERIRAFKGSEDVLEEKIALLEELATFEKSRSTRDPKTGEASDAARLRFKISQAAWASRFEASEGRRLRIEDQLIRVDWARSRRGQAEAKAQEPAVP